MISQPPRQQLSVVNSSSIEWRSSSGAVWATLFRVVPGYLIRFAGLADFEISDDGLNVVAFPVNGIAPATIEHLYLNQVCPLALSRQRKLVLHASAVEIDNCAISFCAESGRGKSSLAASFAMNGTRFLTDDGLQLTWQSSGQCIALPSHPSIRLWRDSQDALVPSAIAKQVALAPSLDYTSKARMLAGDFFPFCAEPRPLRRIYYLGDGSSGTVSIKALSPPQAMIELVRCTFLLDVEESQMLRWQFEQVGRLSGLPIHYRLDYPRRYEDLPQIRAAIIQHVTNHTT